MGRFRPVICIETRDVLALHHRLLAMEGGPVGLREQGLLQSALARPKQLLAYGKRPDVIQLAAAYTVGIVRNHPFVDGNKRTGFVVGVLFVELNGCQFFATEEDAAQAVLSLAAGELSEEAFVEWMRANVKQR